MTYVPAYLGNESNLPSLHEIQCEKERPKYIENHKDHEDLPDEQLDKIASMQHVAEVEEMPVKLRA